jgi:Nucleotidyl transferase of unknown function (DUF2204)
MSHHSGKPALRSGRETGSAKNDVQDQHRRHAFYRRALHVLKDSSIPFLVGGAFGLHAYTGISRDTKDIDVFVQPDDFDRVQKLFASVGFETEVRFPHWLGKAFSGELFVDVIFSSGNGVCAVDSQWFEHASQGEVFSVSVQFCPPEEMIWSKAFIMERERYDGADIAHLILSCGKHMNWTRLIARFGSHWRVLLSHLVLFGFVYPADRNVIPKWVLQELTSRLQDEIKASPPKDRVCQGTLLSWAQYLPKVEGEGYEDARHAPHGTLTAEETAHVTETFKKENEQEH